MVYQPVCGYFMPTGLGIAYILHLYLHFLLVSETFLYTVIIFIDFIMKVNSFE